MSTAIEAPAVDPRELRKVLSTFVTGVTVVTTVDRGGHHHGVTANSFNSVSLNPPLVLWSQALSAFSHPIYRDAEHFAINILSSDQVAISDRFARSGADKFAGVAVREGMNGVPLIEGCAAYLECSSHAAHVAGDHMIFVGRVHRIECSQTKPLAFGGGRYMLAEAHDHARLSGEEARNNRARLHAVRLATHAAIELASRLDVTLGVAVWGTHGPTIVHWEPSSSPVSMNLRVGAVLPIQASATGRVFAAWLAEEQLMPMLRAEWFAEGDAAHAPGPEFGACLEEVRHSGAAVVSSVSAFQDRDGVAVTSASVPVFHGDGSLLLALTVLGESGKPGAPALPDVLQAMKTVAHELNQRFRNGARA